MATQIRGEQIRDRSITEMQLSQDLLDIINSSSNTTFIFNQLSPNTIWHIVHNLHSFPSVTVVDSAGTVVIGEILYIDDVSLDLSFTGGFSGIAYLN